MNKIKKSLVVLLFAVMPAMSFAQETRSLFKQTFEIVEIEIGDYLTLSVFNMPEDGQNHYYLDAGTLGIGDDLIQFNIDPLAHLFIPLGDTLEESQAKLEEFKALAKKPAGTIGETIGCMAIGYPSTEKMEPVCLTSRRFLTQKILEFSIEREGYVRAAHITKGDIGLMITNLKIHRKLHRKEK